MADTSRSRVPALEPATGFLLVRVAEAINRRFVALLAPLGIRPKHLHVLRYLDAYGPMSQQALADGLAVDPGNLIATLDELQAVGLIRREIDRTDRRRRELQITTGGEQTLHRGVAASEQADDEILGTLTNRQRASLRAAALRAYEHLRDSPGYSRSESAWRGRP
jgi:DNA-binding MarR family transcriptional regulator